MKVLSKILISSIICLTLNADNTQLLKPIEKVYDFSNSENYNLTYNAGTIVDKISYEVISELALMPRQFKVENCPSDNFGNIYCPEALSKAGNMWTYDDSEVIETKQYATDFELGNYKEFTSTVRDFMDGFATESTETVIDYTNGTSTGNTSTVVDKTNGTATSNTGTVIDYTNGSIKINTGSVIDYQSNSTATSHVGSVVDYTSRVGTTGVSPTAVPYGLTVNLTGSGYYAHYAYVKGPWCGGTSKTITSETTITAGYYHCADPQEQISLDFIVNPANCTDSGTEVTCSIKNLQNRTLTMRGNSQGIQIVDDLGNSVLSSNKGGSLTLSTKLSCPSGYVMNSNSTQCLKLNPAVEVNNYGIYMVESMTPMNGPYCRVVNTDSNYNCSTSISNIFSLPTISSTSGYTLILETKYVSNPGTPIYGLYRKSTTSCSSGGTLVDISGTKYCTYASATTCPSGYIDNRSSCQKNVNFNYYSYSCPTGYTPVNSGFSSYTKTDPNTGAGNWNILDDAVNSSTAPASNCKKTVTFNYYQYQCPTGYTAADSGRSSCTKTDPSATVNNESTLNDACNSSTAPSNNCGKSVTYQYYTYNCPVGYTATNTGMSSCTRTDSSNTTNNTSTLDDACNSSTSPTGNCTKEISYNYYAYNCPVGYTATNTGMSSCTRTDSSNTTNNTTTLDDACNSSTSPTGNCTKAVYYDYYSYNCSSGYTAIDRGLSTCTRTDSSSTSSNSSTLDDSCNSATPPKENCYKDISYKHYTYGCSAGYITDNYGLSTCPKTDPNKSLNNSSTLDDACNSATPPDGNCRKEVQYSFYKYVCNGVNEFGEPYYPINSGLTSCPRTDPNVNEISSSTMDDACNSSTVASNNCRASAYTCNSNIIQPALVNGEWKCSPFPCNDNRQCGSAVCNDYEPSQTYYMPYSMHQIEAKFSGTCNSLFCDAVLNNKISYCEKFACPTGDGIYAQDGKCLYDECPMGSLINSNGECVVN